MQFTAHLIQFLKYNTNNTTYLKQQVAKSKTHIFSALLIILWYVWRDFQLSSGAQKVSFHSVGAIMGGLRLSARFGQGTIYKGPRIAQFSVIHIQAIGCATHVSANPPYPNERTFRQIPPSDLFEALM